MTIVNLVLEALLKIASLVSTYGGAIKSVKELTPKKEKQKKDELPKIISPFDSGWSSSGDIVKVILLIAVAITILYVLGFGIGVGGIIDIFGFSQGIEIIGRAGIAMFALFIFVRTMQKAKMMLRANANLYGARFTKRGRTHNGIQLEISTR